MSTQLRETGGVVVLPPSGNLTPDAIARASETRWIHNPYRPISNMVPLGLKRPIGYGGERWVTIERCNVYPLGNISWRMEDVEKILDQATSGLSITSTAPVPEKIFTKYAKEQADEMSEVYADDYGLRVLDVFTGIDDAQLISRIFSVVQPRVLKIHEMESEYGIKAKARIEDSDLKPAERKQAEALRKTLLSGSQSAQKEAKREYQDLVASMGKASVGQPGIATPTDFHEWVCDQLNVPCPSPIDKAPRQQSNGKLEGAIELLANRALREESAAESMGAQLEEERAARSREREEFEARLAALENRKSKSA